MKKIKIMLMSVGAFAIVGGVLAFNTHRGVTNVCYETTDSEGNYPQICDLGGVVRYYAGCNKVCPILQLTPLSAQLLT